MHLECNSKINWWATFFYGYYFVLQRSLVFNDHSKYRCKKRAAKKEQERQWLHHKRRVILSISHVWTLQVVIFGGLYAIYVSSRGFMQRTPTGVAKHVLFLKLTPSKLQPANTFWKQVANMNQTPNVLFQGRQ